MQSPRSYGHFEMRLTYEGLLVAKLWAFKKNMCGTCRKLNLKATATRTPCSLQAVSFIKTLKNTTYHDITPCPTLIPGDHQVIAFLAPCLVGFTFDLATYLFHPLKPNQIVVLLVVK